MGSGSNFFETLDRAIAVHPVFSHPFLERISESKLSRDELRAFAEQQYLYSRLFACNLAALVSNIPDEHARTLLVVNMYEEVGEPFRIRDRAHLLLLEAGLVTGVQVGDALEEQVARDRNGDVVALLIEKGIVSRAQVAEVMDHNTTRAMDLTHPALFRRFMRALGFTSEELANAEPIPETTALNETYRSICRDGHWLQGMGAMGPGTECVVPRLYSRILNGIKNSGFVSAMDYVFWTIHVHCDDGHGRNIIDAMKPYAQSAENQRLISEGALAVLDARKRWFDGMHRAVFAEEPKTSGVYRQVRPEVDEPVPLGKAGGSNSER